MKKILVTGGCGFIGRSLVDVLSNDDDLIIVMDNMSNPNSIFPERWKNKKIRLVKKSVSDTIFWNTFEPVDEVYHLACMQQRESFNIPYDEAMTDYIGTINVLEYGRKHGVKILFTSSVSVESKSDTPYSISKEAAEKICLWYRTYKGVDVVIIRYSNVYGPGNTNGVVGKFLINDELEIAGNGFLTRDFTFIDDAIKCTLLASKERPEEIVSIGTGVEISISKVASLFGKSTRSVPVKDEDKPYFRVVKVDRCRDYLGFVPDTSIEDGIKETIRRWDEERDTYY
jgi:UDP-glucose 4-epimerase